MEDKRLNEKESLALITQMIENTRNRFIRNSGTPFLIGGYTTIFVTLLVWYFWKTTGNSMWNLAWFLIPVIGGVFSYFYQRKREKQIYVKTYIDRLTRQVWQLLGGSVLILSVTAFFVRLPILFLVLFFMSTGMAVTGLAIRFKPVVACGLGGILISYSLLFITGINQLPVFGAAFLLMIIAGHWQNYICKKKESNKTTISSEFLASQD